jgi:hypothetical protein
MTISAALRMALMPRMVAYGRAIEQGAAGGRDPSAQCPPALRKVAIARSMSGRGLA